MRRGPLALVPINSLEAKQQKQQPNLLDRYYRILRPSGQEP